MNLPEFGVNRPVTNLMIFLAVLVVSFYCLAHMALDLMPEIEPPMISVVSSYPGASPEDVETKVTEVLENQLATTPGVEKISSRSLEGISIITLKFHWRTNLDVATSDVRDRIEIAKRFLPDIPEEMDNPYIFKFNTSMIPILFVGITAKENYPILYDLIDERLADPIRQIPGVGTVQIYGGLQRQINVWIDNNKLEAYGLSILDIQNALRQNNISQPLGNLKSGFTNYLIRLPGEFSAIEDMNSVILLRKEGKMIYLKDVARIEDGFKEPTMFVRHNRNKGLMLVIQKQTGTNTVEVAQKVKKKLAQLTKILPADINIFIIFDTSEDIINTLNTLKKTIQQALVFVVLVVWFFLHQIKTSIIVGLSIPFSLLITFIYLYLSGKTLNVISLSSLIISSGMVVDNAIVVVDNFLRHLDKGERPREAAIFGTKEVYLALFASTLTTVAVFLPMLLLTKSIVGIMFGELAIIVTVSLFASLFTATTFSPMLCFQWFKNFNSQEKISKLSNLLERLFRKIEEFYASVLEFCLRHKKFVTLGFLLIFVSSLGLMRFVENEFIPDQDTGDLRATVALPLGTRLEETDKLAKKIEEIFEREVPEKRIMFVRAGTAPSIGRAMSASGESGENIIMAGLKLIPKQQRKRSVFEIGQLIRKKINELPGVIKLGFTLGNPIGRMITGMGGKAIQLEIIGHSFEETDNLANKIRGLMQEIEGVVDISISRDIGLPEIRIKVDREKLSALGLNMYTISSTLKTFIEGSIASRYREKGQTYDIYLRLEENARQKLEDIQNLVFVSPISGKSLKLASFAQIIETIGPQEIERVNRERVVRVECNVFGKSVGKVREELEKKLNTLVIPHDIKINFGGEVEEQTKAFRELSILLLLSIVLVYMVMAGQFESLQDPFIVMFSLPFTFTGVILGFILTNTTLNIVSFVGIVMLMGIVVNNAIVLVSYINILRKRGYSILTAVKEGSKARLRPVLMTTITTLAGLFPMAVFRGEGSEVWRPLGITMISGLSVSTFVTLLLIPTFYAIIKKIKNA